MNKKTKFKAKIWDLFYLFWKKKHKNNCLWNYDYLFFFISKFSVLYLSFNAVRVFLSFIPYLFFLNLFLLSFFSIGPGFRAGWYFLCIFSSDQFKGKKFKKKQSESHERTRSWNEVYIDEALFDFFKFSATI